MNLRCLRLEKAFNLLKKETIAIVADHIPKEAKYDQISFFVKSAFCLYFMTTLELCNKNGSKQGFRCAKLGDRVNTNFKVRN